jgi:hypothetical protein
LVRASRLNYGEINPENSNCRYGRIGFGFLTGVQANKISRDFNIFWSTVPQSEFFKHDHKAGAKGIDGFDVKILLHFGIEKDIEIGSQVIFRPPVTNQ